MQASLQFPPWSPAGLSHTGQAVSFWAGSGRDAQSAAEAVNKRFLQFRSGEPPALSVVLGPGSSVAATLALKVTVPQAEGW